ncbi:DNA alkylation repair protein [Micromonospora sp. NPDC048843]|uniref:DNA alkylation repair protein n=1 Tax=Micromonospora sp. NPDC048843 TaxID=3155389 RepID=UPI0034039483
MATTVDVRRALASLADPRRAEASSRFLQMVPGGYGEGDRALGVSVPDQRTVAARFWRDLPLAETTKLLTGGAHEERLTALLILVWGRRIAIMATFAFIRAGDFEWTFRLADRLLHDPHDLVRKAVGWMLREVGNRDQAAEEEFLARRYRVMPRVMLRYAIEKFEPQRRRDYLSGAL